MAGLVYPSTVSSWARIWPGIVPVGGIPAFLSTEPVELEHQLIDWALVDRHRGRSEMKRQIEAGEEPDAGPGRLVPRTARDLARGPR